MVIVCRCDRCNKDLKVELPPKNMRFDIHVYGRTVEGEDTQLYFDLCEECKAAFFSEYMHFDTRKESV